MITHSSRVRRGFTLVELMITLVIAAILISIAIPSYRRYVLRSQRTDATVALMRIQSAQEKYFLQNNGYATQLTPTPPAGLALAQTSDGGFYDIQLTPGDTTPSASGVAVAMDYTVKATPRAGSGQTEDKRCAEFSVDHNGVKHAKDSSGQDNTSECWR